MRLSPYVAGGAALGTVAVLGDELVDVPDRAGDAVAAVAGGGAVFGGSRMVARGESLAKLGTTQVGRGTLAVGAGLLAAAALGTIVDLARERSSGARVSAVEREFATTDTTLGSAARMAPELEPEGHATPAPGFLDVVGATPAHAAEAYVDRYDSSGDGIVYADEAQVVVDGRTMSIAHRFGNMTDATAIRRSMQQLAPGWNERVGVDDAIELDVTWDSTAFIESITSAGRLPDGRSLRPWRNDMPIFFIPDSGGDSPEWTAYYLADMRDVAVVRLPDGAPTRFGAIRIEGHAMQRGEPGWFDHLPAQVVALETVSGNATRSGRYHWSEDG